MRLASRIAINRTIAGMHFPVDSVAGAVLGMTLGKYLVARATGGAAYEAWKFDGAGYPEHQDFDWKLQYSVPDDKQTAVDGYVVGPMAQSDDTLASPILNVLWENARAEWQIGSPPKAGA